MNCYTKARIVVSNRDILPNEFVTAQLYATAVLRRIIRPTATVEQQLNPAVQFIMDYQYSEDCDNAR